MAWASAIVMVAKQEENSEANPSGLRFTLLSHWLIDMEGAERKDLQWCRDFANTNGTEDPRGG
jgi:hypothetical protein